MGEIKEKPNKIFSKNNLCLLVVMLIVSSAIFLFFREDYKIYRTETSVIVFGDKQTVETIAVLPKKLSFYERVLKENENIKDYFDGYSDDKRKDLWNDVMSSELENGSSIVRISMKDGDKSRSEELSEASVKTLFEFSNEFYGNKVKLQIIEGSILYSETGNLLLLISFSLLLGVANSLVVKLFLRSTLSRGIVNLIVERKKKLAHAGLAYSFDYAVNWLFNYPLYGYVIWKYGLEKGFFIMAFLSFLICWIYIIIYDIIKKDLFLIEDAKEFMDRFANYDGKFRILGFLAFLIRKGGKVTAFFLLSFFKDPFYVTAFCRNGKYNGLSFRDWMIFLASVIVSNVPWALAVFGGVKGIEFLVN